MLFPRFMARHSIAFSILDNIRVPLVFRTTIGICDAKSEGSAISHLTEMLAGDVVDLRRDYYAIRGTSKAVWKKSCWYLISVGMVAQLRLSNPHVFLSVAVWKTRPDLSRAHIPSFSSSVSFFPLSVVVSFFFYFSSSQLRSFSLLFLARHGVPPSRFSSVDVLPRMTSRRFCEEFISPRLGNWFSLYGNWLMISRNANCAWYDTIREIAMYLRVSSGCLIFNIVPFFPLLEYLFVVN